MARSAADNADERASNQQKFTIETNLPEASSGFRFGGGEHSAKNYSTKTFEKFKKII